MMGLFNKNKQQDERIVQIKNKIYAEIYIMVIIICFISAGLKLYFFHQTVYTEIIILLAGGVYFLYRSVQLGVVSSEVELHDRRSKRSMNQKNLIWSIVLGVVIAVFMGLNSALQYADGTGERVEYFLMVGLVTLLMYVPFLIIVLVVGSEVAKQKSDKMMNKLLDDEESGDDIEKH